jgi:ATP-binding cassette subfamily F protein 3
LDIESKEALENALLNYAGTILTISHDRYFLNKIANKIFDLQPDGLSEYLGNFNYYLEKKAIMEKELEDEITISDTSTSEISSSKLSRQKEKELERQIRSLSRKLEQTETEIAECEALIEDLNTSLCSPDVYSDHEKSLKLNEDLELANQKLEMLYSTWENIQEELLELQ